MTSATTRGSQFVNRHDDEPARAAPGGVVRVLRGLAGVVAYGLALFTAMLLVVQWVSATADVRGPGAEALIGHGVGAVVAVLLQRLADRTRGPLVAVTSIAVLVTTALVLWLGWWR